jgi:hypothetical protein
MKPQKSDFPGILQLPLNVEDRLINPHIEDAYKFDVRGKLTELAIDIYNYTPESPTPTRPELIAFYETYVLEWWVRLAYYRFYEVHGDNVTQFGVTRTKDPAGSFEQIDDKRRAIRLTRLKADTDTLYQYILQQTWKFDDVVYAKPCKPDKGYFGINAIG